MFRKPKDKLEKDTTTAVVYKVKCKDCEKTCTGQTNRALKTKLKEHKKAIFLEDPNSHLVQHHVHASHEFDLDNALIINQCKRWSGRIMLEAWHSIRNKNTINEHIHGPCVYGTLREYPL